MLCKLQTVPMYLRWSHVSLCAPDISQTSVRLVKALAGGAYLPIYSTRCNFRNQDSSSEQSLPFFPELYSIIKENNFERFFNKFIFMCAIDNNAAMIMIYIKLFIVLDAI